MELLLRFHKRLTFSADQYIQAKNRLMFIMGDHDRTACFPESLRAIAELDLNLKIIKDAGHTVNYNNTAEVNAAVAGFLKQQPQPGTGKILN